MMQQSGLMRQLLLAGVRAGRYELRTLSSISSRESVAQVVNRQLGRSKGTYQPTLDQALLVSDPACVITEATAPFRICHVNQAWVDLCGFTEGEAVGNTLSIIQGPSTSKATVFEMHQVIKNRQPGVFMLVNYQKNGTPFFNKLGILPVEQSGQVTHFMGLLQKL
eukprot:TRINITY_DN1505_c0_g1_i11.p3 TRINITY_DN1505_c0_g1~~TRINITY_DN1505_c0_g1_i11.p3  ORF type:complete len:165 (-),score=15.26 TRINITY_DN1505_c0_g1_i11:1651-2145(-)